MIRVSVISSNSEWMSFAMRYDSAGLKRDKQAPSASAATTPFLDIILLLQYNFFNWKHIGYFTVFRIPQPESAAAPVHACPNLQSRGEK